MIKLIIQVTLIGYAFGDLVSLPEESNLFANISCCKDDFALTCQKADVNLAEIGQKILKLPNDITLSLDHNIANDPNSYDYKGDKGEFILTYDPPSRSLIGELDLDEGKYFVLENCGEEGHAWKEIDVQKRDQWKMGLNDEVGTGEDYISGKDYLGKAEDLSLQMDKSGTSIDTTTSVNISVKFYYTPTFAAKIPNIELEVKNMINLANLAYENSRVPIRIVQHCAAQELDIVDVTDMHDMFDLFEAMDKSWDHTKLRNTADLATLLGFYCNGGKAQFLGYLNVVCKGGFKDATFDHEIGHNIGLFHDIDTLKEYGEGLNQKFPKGHGYIFNKGPVGFATIMAYTDPRGAYNRTRIRYYSDPDRIHPKLKMPLGIEGAEIVTDSVSVLMKRRFEVASNGDESSCTPFYKNKFKTLTTVAPTTTTTTTITSTTTSTTELPSGQKLCERSNNVGKARLQILENQYVKDIEECRKLCSRHFGCYYWTLDTYNQSYMGLNLCILYRLRYMGDRKTVSCLPKICTPQNLYQGYLNKLKKIKVSNEDSCDAECKKYPGQECDTWYFEENHNICHLENNFQTDMLAKTSSKYCR